MYLHGPGSDDDDLMVMLQEYLQRWKKTLVVVSHDRDFLNMVTTDIIHLHDLKLHYYRGNFAQVTASRVPAPQHQQCPHVAPQLHAACGNPRQEVEGPDIVSCMVGRHCMHSQHAEQ